jgi:DNA-binding beta-propeller fold protein YncE
VYVFSRGEHPVMIFDPVGNFLGSWGEGMFARPHGIFIGPDDSVYCIDDKYHTVTKCTLDGRVLMTLGNKGQPSDTGYDGKDSCTIRRAGPPFNRPTNVALSAEGDIYVSDGYGNCCVHKFSPDGKLLSSWGEPGTGPGQFCQVHNIRIDAQQRVYIADRENNRIQVFTLNGEFLSEWTGLHRPTGLFLGPDSNLYVTENHVAPTAGRAFIPPQLSVWSLDGKLLARWGGEDYSVPGNFFTPHALWGNSRGDLYVGENPESASRGRLTPGSPLLHKLVRVK